MAEETELPLREGAETLDAPPEDGVGEQQLDPVEALAAEMGWAPKDKFRGEEADWKPAADFIKAGRDISRSISRKLASVEDQLRNVGGVTNQIIADKIAERDAYWQGIHAKAVEDGDQDAAKRAISEIVKNQAQAPAADKFQEPPETQDFRERNKAWFGDGGNRLATARAMEVAERSRQMGASPAEQLQDAEAAIRREYPELFKGAGKTAPGVQTGGARNAGQGSGPKKFADMPAESQALAKDMLARHGVPLEKFAAKYFEQQAQRKVG